ncbi:hypothetical protein R6Q59_022498 [Mikania micrantha]
MWIIPTHLTLLAATCEDDYTLKSMWSIHMTEFNEQFSHYAYVVCNDVADIQNSCFINWRHMEAWSIMGQLAKPLY